MEDKVINNFEELQEYFGLTASMNNKNRHEMREFIRERHPNVITVLFCEFNVCFMMKRMHVDLFYPIDARDIDYFLGKK